MEFSNRISHRFTRARVLNEYRDGKRRASSLCDADFILITAANYHGYPAEYPCPICESTELRTVYWIYGEELAKASRSAANSARNLEEIARFARAGLSFNVHTVEVCPQCKWNYLLEEALVEGQV